MLFFTTSVEKKHSLFVLLLFFALASILTARFQSKINKREKECSFPQRAWKRAFFVSFIDFFALASILTARFNRRSIKEREREICLFASNLFNKLPLKTHKKNNNFTF